MARLYRALYFLRLLGGSEDDEIFALWFRVLHNNNHVPETGLGILYMFCLFLAASQQGRVFKKCL